MSLICAIYNQEARDAGARYWQESWTRSGSLTVGLETTWNGQSVSFATVSRLTGDKQAGTSSLELSGDEPHITASVRIAADCRLDNRQELMTKLQQNGRFLLTDEQLIKLAYLKWGTACVEHLVGDFAFILWDESNAILLCARDPMGLRPLFYKVDGPAIYIASRIKDIHRTDGIQHWNIRYLTDFLYRKGVPPEEETPYPEVKRVPKGAYMTVISGVINVVKYWELEYGPIRYKQDMEYEEHFRALFSAAVNDRARGTGDRPIAVSMSGGLDSTSIYGVAKQYGANRSIIPISCVFERDPSADERPYIQMILDQYQEKNAEFVMSDDYWMLKGFPNYSPDADEPNRNQMSYAMLAATFAKASQYGAPLLFSGYGGDQVFGFSPYYISDYLKKGKLLRLLQESRQLAKAYNDPLLWTLKEYALGAVQGKHEKPTVLNPSMHKEAQERFEKENAIRNPGLRMQYQYIQRSQGFGFAQEVASSFGIEMAYPFLDVRLVHFLFNIPVEQKIRQAQTKVLLRRSMKGIVPDGILSQQGKAATHQMIFEGLKQGWQHIYPLLKCPVLEELGLINGNQFREQIQRYRQGEMSRGMDYFTALLLELWVREHMQKGS